MSGFELKKAPDIASSQERTDERPGRGSAREVLISIFDNVRLVGSCCHQETYRACSREAGSIQLLLHVFRGIDTFERELFRLESLAAAKLSHNHIVSTDPPQELQGILFTKAELRSDFEALQQSLDRQGWFEPEAALVIVEQVADAIEYAHNKGILHLCLNPDEILLRPDGTVLVTGFGIDATGQSAWAHRRRSRRCPVHYLSPEQAAERPVDPRTDLYALGVIAYKMLTDRFPLDAEDPQSVKDKHMNQSPLPPHFYSADIPMALSDVIMCLLEKHPDARYQNIDSLRSDLRKLNVDYFAATTSYSPQVEDKADVLQITLVQDDVDAPIAVDEVSAQDPDIAADEYDESPIRDEDFTDPSLRESWDPPSITVIDPPTSKVFEVQIQMDQPYDRYEGYEPDNAPLPHLNYLASDGFNSSYGSAKQWRPVVLVVFLTIAAVGGLIVLAHADRYNPSPSTNAAVPAKTQSEGNQDQGSNAAPSVKTEEAPSPATSAAGLSVNANPPVSAGSPANRISKKGPTANSKKVETRNGWWQRSHSAKRKPARPTLYFRPTRVGDRR